MEYLKLVGAFLAGTLFMWSLLSWRFASRQIEEKKKKALEELFNGLGRIMGKAPHKFNLGLDLTRNCVRALSSEGVCSWHIEVTVEMTKDTPYAYVLHTIGSACGQSSRYEIKNPYRASLIYRTMLDAFSRDVR